MITLSASARTQVEQLLNNEPEPGEVFLRLYVTEGGCSGYNYGLALDNELGEGDRLCQQEGVRVVVNEKSLPLLDGAEVDFVEGLTGRGFSIHNPHALKTCACGQSFRAEEDEGVPEPCE